MKNIYLQTIALAGASLYLVGCSDGSTYHNPNPPVTTSTTMSISNVVNYGIGNNGQISIELDGSFFGASDTVSISCVTNTGPSYSIVSDKTDQIILEMPPMSDSCTFKVQNSGQTSNVSPAISLSAFQGALKINYAYDYGFTGNLDKIVVYGLFTGNDNVWASCDSSGQFTEVTGISLNNINEIDFTIPAPSNFNSCQFYVEGNTVQSPTYNVISINQVADNGPSSPTTDAITLSGTFVGDGNDVVYASCDGASGFSSYSNFTHDSATEIDISIPAPSNFSSCQFIVANNQVQTNTYSILSIQSIYELGTSGGGDAFVVQGTFAGFNDKVWAACDGNVFAQASLNLDSVAQLKFTIPTPSDLASCQVYVQNGSYQTSIYSMGMTPIGLPVHTLHQKKTN